MPSNLLMTLMTILAFTSCKQAELASAPSESSASLETYSDFTKADYVKKCTIALGPTPKQFNCIDPQHSVEIPTYIETPDGSAKLAEYSDFLNGQIHRCDNAPSFPMPKKESCFPHNRIAKYETEKTTWSLFCRQLQLRKREDAFIFDAIGIIARNRETGAT